MREIKFRGKTAFGKWVFGDLIRYKNLNFAILGQPFSGFGYEANELEKSWLVVPETVGQYTGMKDVNGTDIYEGDILQCDLEPDVLDVVFWDKTNACFATRPNYIDFETMPDPFMKVVGNIYENSVLFNND